MNGVADATHAIGIAREVLRPAKGAGLKTTLLESAKPCIANARDPSTA